MYRYLLIAVVLLAACASAPVVTQPAAEATLPPPVEDAAGVLNAVERRDRDALEKAARSVDPALRAAAVGGIGALQDPAGTRLVRLALRDEDAGVRHTAALAAGQIASGRLPFDPAERKALGDTVAGALAIEADAPIRRALLWSLARIGGPNRPLFVALVDEDEAMRTEALLGLGLVLADRPAEELDEGLTAAAIADAAAAHARDPDAETRAAVAWLLGRLRYAPSEELLAALARDGDAQVRAFAARALGEVTSQPSLLEALVGDPIVQVRVEAARGLVGAAERMGRAGVKGTADLTREEAFARALERSVQALALQLGKGGDAGDERGDALALHPLLLLARDVCSPASRPQWCGSGRSQREPSASLVLPARAAAQARRALDVAASRAAPAGHRRQPQDRGDVVLHTARGSVHIVLDDEGAPLAAARFRAAIARGSWNGAEVARLEPGVLLQLEPGVARDGEAALATENAAAPWVRGTVGTTLDGEAAGLVVAFARSPGFEGRATPVGRVVAGMEVLDSILPGDAILQVVLH